MKRKTKFVTMLYSRIIEMTAAVLLGRTEWQGCLFCKMVSENGGSVFNSVKCAIVGKFNLTRGQMIM